MASADDDVFAARQRVVTSKLGTFITNESHVGGNTGTAACEKIHIKRFSVAELTLNVTQMIPFDSLYTTSY